MRLLTPHTAHLAAEWWDAAVNDPAVRPWLSTAVHLEAPTIDGSTWNSAFFLSDCRRGLLRLANYRAEREAALCVYVLGANYTVAAKMLAWAVKNQTFVFAGIDTLRSTVNDKNVKSLRMTERFMGPPISHEPGEAIYEGVIGAAGIYRYKAPLVDAIARIKDSRIFSRYV